MQCQTGNTDKTVGEAQGMLYILCIIPFKNTCILYFYLFKFGENLHEIIDPQVSYSPYLKIHRISYLSSQ